jgi:hypothetical protein
MTDRKIKTKIQNQTSLAKTNFPKSYSIIAIAIVLLFSVASSYARERKVDSRKFSRIHLVLEPSLYYYDYGGTNPNKILAGWGFGDHLTYWIAGTLYEPEQSGSWQFPNLSGGPSKFFRLWNFGIQYSISRQFALGFFTSPIEKFHNAGFDYFTTISYPGFCITDSGIGLNSDFKGRTYYITASYMPAPEDYHKRSSPKAGIGLGISDIDLTFKVDDFCTNPRFSTPVTGNPNKGDRLSFSKKSLSCLAFVAYDYWFGRNLSLGLYVNYRFVPFKLETFRLTGYYLIPVPNPFPLNPQLIEGSKTYELSGQMLNLAGWSIGVSFGFHL